MGEHGFLLASCTWNAHGVCLPSTTDRVESVQKAMRTCESLRAKLALLFPQPSPAPTTLGSEGCRISTSASLTQAAGRWPQHQNSTTNGKHTCTVQANTRTRREGHPSRHTNDSTHALRTCAATIHQLVIPNPRPPPPPRGARHAPTEPRRAPMTHLHSQCKQPTPPSTLLAAPATEQVTKTQDSESTGVDVNRTLHIASSAPSQHSAGHNCRQL